MRILPFRDFGVVMNKLIGVLILFAFVSCNQSQEGEFFEKTELVKENSDENNSNKPKSNSSAEEPKIENPIVSETEPEEKIVDETQGEESETPEEIDQVPESRPGSMPTPRPMPEEIDQVPESRPGSMPTPRPMPEEVDQGPETNLDDEFVIDSSGEEDLFETITDLITIENEKDIACSPLSDNVKDVKAGVIGEVRVVKSYGKRNVNNLRNNLLNYLNPKTSEKLSLKVFMNNVDVPERRFDKGFKTNSQQILSHNGKHLLEWFNVNLESDIKLVNKEEEGLYEFMIISDDGSILSLSEIGGELQRENLLYAPGLQAPKVVCHNQNKEYGKSLVKLEYGKRYRMKLNYYQGPKYRIALQLFWRKVPDRNATDLVKHKLCGRQLSGKKKIDFLESSGFKIIIPKYFNLPGTEVNQCKETFIDTFKLSKKPSDMNAIKISINDVDYTGGYTQVVKDDDKDSIYIKLNDPVSQFEKHVVKFVYDTNKESTEETHEQLDVIREEIENVGDEVSYN